MWILLFAAFLALAAAPPLPAQFPPDVTVGTRVRVVLPDSLRQAWGWPREQWVRGDVAALATDTLYLRVSGMESPVLIRRAAIKRIDRSLGVPTPAESAIRGAVGWALIGALLGYATGWPDWPDGRGERSAGDRAALGAASGAVAGFVLGAIFPTERWRRVRIR
jgi:hypothetical protein